MAEDKNALEPDIISVNDEDGNEILFELLERYEDENGVYVAITEYRDDAEEIVDGDYEVIILKVINEGDEEYLEEIESEEEYERVSDILMKMVEESYDVEYYESMWEVDFLGDRSNANEWTNGRIGDLIGLQSNGSSDYKEFNCNYSYGQYDGSPKLWYLYTRDDRTDKEYGNILMRFCARWNRKKSRCSKSKCT